MIFMAHDIMLVGQVFVFIFSTDLFELVSPTLYYCGWSMYTLYLC